MPLQQDDILEALRWSGYKLTGPRLRVIQSLIQNHDQHHTVEELYDDINRVNPPVGLATVYRTLNLLYELDMVTKLELDDGFDRYELADSSDHQHHHLICSRCNQIIEVKEDFLEELEDRLLRDYGFYVTGHHVKFYGLCQACYKKKEE
jgi:Fur family ferric uptake transcriptional regulator